MQWTYSREIQIDWHNHWYDRNVWHRGGSDSYDYVTGEVKPITGWWWHKLDQHQPEQRLKY